MYLRPGRGWYVGNVGVEDVETYLHTLPVEAWYVSEAR